MSKKVLAITACPTGVAHTYMAAESLENAGKEMGVDLKVETHGSVGRENEFTQADIDQAEGLIIAADVKVSRDRFHHLPVIEVPVRKGIDDPKELIQRTLNHEGSTSRQEVNTSEPPQDRTNQDSVGKRIYGALMNGVSHMIPFVVTGGLLIAVALSIGGVPTADGFAIPETSFWFHINNIGGAAMSFMGPVLAAYIAHAIADRPGLVPGMVGGYIAMNGAFYGSEANTGFLGAIIAGFIAGYTAQLIKKIKVPKAVDSVMPIIFIPIISTLVVSLIFIFVIGQPVASLFDALTNWLTGLQGANAAVLGAILGAMIAVDMGGPFNKTAFLVGSGLIAQGETSVMGANAVAICIPPLTMGLASFIYRKKFTEKDRSTGVAALFMGFFGITEGAIPFAAKNPIRVIPSIVIGSAVGGSIAMVTGVTDSVAHGGPIVALLGAVGNVPMFIVAVTVGIIVTVILLGLLMPNLPSAALAVEDQTVGNDPELTENREDKGEPTAKPTASTVEEDSEVGLEHLTNKDLIVMDLHAQTKEKGFKELLTLPALDGVVKNQRQVLEALNERESQGSTGMGDGIAIPHAKSSEIKEARVVFARSDQGIDWASVDGNPVHLIFMILVPEHQQGDLHLKILQALARNLMHNDFKEQLFQAKTKDEVYEMLTSM